MSTHTPSRKQTVLFLFFTLILAGGIFLWVFFINKGTLAVEGEIPFKVAAGNYEKMCEDSPCSITLNPKKYIVTVSKEGFFPYTETVDIIRNETVTVTPKFTFIPILRERTSNIPIFDTEKENEKRAGAEREALRSFQRPLKNPIPLSNAKATRVLIMEGTDNSRVYYLIDVLTGSRKRLEISETSRNPKWAGDFIVFEDGEDLNKKVFMVDAVSLLRTELPAVDSKNIIERQPGMLVFVSAKKQDSEKPKFGPLISEVLEETKNELFDSSLKPSVWFITEFSIASGIMKTIVNVSAKDSSPIRNLTADPDGNRLYFEQGDKVFEVLYNAPPS